MIPPCNSCGGELSRIEVEEHWTEEAGGTHYRCPCGQSISVYPSGRSTQIILPCLYPTPRTHRDHHEQVDYNLGQAEFFSLLMVDAGLRSQEEHDELLVVWSVQVEEHKAKWPLPQPRRWWPRRRNNA